MTSRPVRGRRQGERLIQSYMDRWSCEEGYRFSKQGFKLESVGARRFTSLQNLVALASLAWALLADGQQDANVLLHKAKRQKPNKTLRFPFYSLLQGWQQLFAPAKHIFYRWWRQQTQHKQPPSLTLNLFDHHPSLYNNL